MSSFRLIAAPLCIALLIAFIGIQSGSGQCYTLPSPDSGEVRIFAQSVCGGVDNDPPNPTVFTLDAPYVITKIGTYHWNNGAGATPGTIGLKGKDGTIYGPWHATGEPGQGGVQDAYWIASIPDGLDLTAGTYEVIDSDPLTWAYNSESENCGVVSVIGRSAGSANNHDGGSKMIGQPPCAVDAVDFSPSSLTDLYDAGPRLVPGSYKFYSGIRTGTQIGKPDSWQTYGPFELHGGKFYVFDVLSGELREQDPKMINSMMNQPGPTESMVWYRLSTENAYVVCFDGPLNGANGGIRLAGNWDMAGHQTSFNDWKASLVLNSDYTLRWTETEGANVGATRSGTWQFDGTTLTLEWVSPGGGQTSWISREVTKNTINSGTYTVENAPGGTWFAARSYAGTNEAL
ncbi:MAG: hypothetical protein ACE14P_05660 [Methanotrichaceae archaeon]